MFKSWKVVTIVTCMFLLASINVNAEDTSKTPTQEDVVITNNVRNYDLVNIKNLAPYDYVTVYDSLGETKIATGAVSSRDSELTLKIRQLGSDDGSVMISIRSKNNPESEKASYSYEAESVTSPPLTESIIIDNKVLLPDEITVSNVYEGDTINIYKNNSDTIPQTTAKVAKGSSQAILKIKQLGKDAGSIYVSIIGIYSLESAKVKVDFPAEPVSDPLDSSDVTVENFKDKSDTITINNLKSEDIINLYLNENDTKATVTGKVKSNATQLVLNIKQLGIEANSFYLTVTNKYKLESNKVKIDFSDEYVSSIIDISKISVENNANTSDIITINGVNDGDIIFVYANETTTNKLGSGRCKAGTNLLSLNISQLGKESGSIYVTLTERYKHESPRLKVDYEAEKKSDPIDASHVYCENNFKKSDLVSINGLSMKDIVKIYSAAENGVIIKQGVAIKDSSVLSFIISQLGKESGSIYITVTQYKKFESDRVKVDFACEPKTAPIPVDNVTIINNVRKNDLILVKGLTEKNVVKVYDSENDVFPIASGIVQSKKTEVSIIVSQLGISAGSVYITIDNKINSESDRVKTDYLSESVSDSILESSVTVTNNAYISDIIDITGLAKNDLVKIYSDESTVKEIASGTYLGNGTTNFSLNVAQLGSDDGFIYISNTSSDKLESTRTKISYIAERPSVDLNKDTISIVNNAGNDDVITIKGLLKDDIVKFYSSNTDTAPLKSITISADAEEVLKVEQLGTNSGTVYISRINKGKKESTRVDVSYLAEVQTDTVLLSNVEISNLVGESDLITVKGLTAKDIVNVYSTGDTPKVIGTGTVKTDETEIKIKITQLGSTASSVDITAKSLNKLESSKLNVLYSAEPQSTALSISDDIKVINNVDEVDTVEVLNLSAGNIINIYQTDISTATIGTFTVADNNTSGKVSIKQLGKTSGSIYLTITIKGNLESTRTKVDYVAEAISTILSTENIDLTNNAGIDDTIKITNLNESDVVTVYDSAKDGKTLGTDTVKTSATEANIKITQLGTNGGSIYISVKNKNKLESERLKVDFVKEEKSSILISDDIVIDNNAGEEDIIKVSNLNESDTVKVYAKELGGNPIGTSVVTAFGTEVSVKVTQLGSLEGYAYITVVKKGKLESDRLKMHFNAEIQSSISDTVNSVITNNAGIDDTIYVYGLKAYDTVKVYTLETGGTKLVSKTLTAYETNATLTTPQLGKDSGSIYISITSKTKLESSRKKFDYEAEKKSSILNSSNISVVNNVKDDDLINFSFILPGDIVKVYNKAINGDLLGSATVASTDNNASVEISQLGKDSGSLYVTITNKGYLESDRIQIYYIAEQTSVPILSSNVEVLNYAGIDDKVNITFLNEDDKISIYNQEFGGTLLAEATVAKGKTDTSISISQIGSSSGNLYISVTNKGKLESSKVKVYYSAEKKSDTVYSSNVNVYNYSGLSDTVEVLFLSPGDTVSIYDSQTNGKLISKTTVGSIDNKATFTINQLGTSSGSIFISIQANGKLESERTKVDYLAEVQTSPLTLNSITISNYAGLNDEIKVTGIKEKDVVKIYDSLTGGNLINSCEVETGNTSLTALVKQLGKESGKIYMSIASYGEKESSRIEVTFNAEAISPELADNQIIITLNTGRSDIIDFSGLQTGDIIKVYDLNADGVLLGNGTSTGSTISIKVSELGSTGSIFISLTRKGYLESGRKEVLY